MRVISFKTLREFWEIDPDAETPLRTWHHIALIEEWKNLSEVRGMFPHADAVGDLTVFNIGGNKYRLIVRIRYDFQLINIRAVLTHKEYDKGDWKT